MVYTVAYTSFTKVKNIKRVVLPLVLQLDIESYLLNSMPQDLVLEMELTLLEEQVLVLVVEFLTENINIFVMLSSNSN